MTALRYLSLAAWMAALLSAFGVYSVYGLPHVIFEYSFRDNGHPYDVSVTRHYLTCTFIGPYGAFAVPAEAGRCGWVRFFQAADGAQ